ncbi:MAG: hypothetical protein V1917_04305 [Candidatus Gottesmanbacteria bacterium]
MLKQGFNTLTMQRTILLILGSAVAVGLLVVAIRSMNGQDTWVCENGQLVQKGKPIFPKPNYVCPTITPTEAPVKK